MIKVVNGIFFNVDTPHGKAAYTVALQKQRKVEKIKKQEKDINRAMLSNIERCNRNKKGQM